MSTERIVFDDQLRREFQALLSAVSDVDRHLAQHKYTRAGMHAQSCFQHLGRVVWLCAEGAVRGWDRDAA